LRGQKKKLNANWEHTNTKTVKTKGFPKGGGQQRGKLSGGKGNKKTNELGVGPHNVPQNSQRGKKKITWGDFQAKRKKGCDQLATRGESQRARTKAEKRQRRLCK